MVEDVDLCINIYHLHPLNMLSMNLDVYVGVLWSFSLITFVIPEKASQSNSESEVEESKLPLQLAIVGRPNVGKSTMLNALLQQERVLVGPEAGLTRDSVRAEFQYQGRTVYLVKKTLSSYSFWYLF